MSEPVDITTARVLSARLERLRAERDSLAAQTRVEKRGDLADQATDVEASIRLQLLDERIDALELEIDQAGRRERIEGQVCVGDLVTLDFGDGEENYLIGSVEQAYAGIDTITPGSPLGQALVGAAVGSTVTYEPRPGRPTEVLVKTIGEMLPVSA